jgi:hemerythrin
MVWDDTYSVKVNRCDLEHQRLFGIINALQDAMSAGKGRNVVQRIVRELNAYAKTHFSSEEMLLERAGYPALARHRSEHQAFIAEVTHFEKSIANGNVLISVEVMDFLRRWLSNHILQTDRQYSEHLNRNGIK